MDETVQPPCLWLPRLSAEIKFSLPSVELSQSHGHVPGRSSYPLSEGTLAAGILTGSHRVQPGMLAAAGNPGLGVGPGLDPTVLWARAFRVFGSQWPLAKQAGGGEVGDMDPL